MVHIIVVGQLRWRLGCVGQVEQPWCSAGSGPATAGFPLLPHTTAALTSFSPAAQNILHARCGRCPKNNNNRNFQMFKLIFEASCDNADSEETVLQP